jgi:hypothetical protein
VLHALFCALFIVYACAGWIKKNTLGRALAQIWPRHTSKFIGAMMLYGTSQMNGTKGWCASSIYFLLSLSCNRPAAELIV